MAQSKYLKSCVMVAAAAAISGCSSIDEMIEKNPIYGDHALIRDRSQDYEKEQQGKALVIPERLQAKRTQDLLQIPNTGETGAKRSGSYKVPRPEFFYAETGSESVSLRSLGQDKVVMVDEPIGDAWHKVMKFMEYNNLGVADANARQGTVESDWIVLKGDEEGLFEGWFNTLTFQDGDTSTKNKVKITLRPDADDDGRTAIAMATVNYPAKEQVETIDWQGDANNLAYKSDMMFELLRFMSKASASPSGSGTLASSFNRTRQTEVVQFGRNSEGLPALKVNLPIDKAWQLTSQALDKAEIDVGTRDQSLGIFYLTFTSTTPADQGKKKSFFEWLHGDREDIKLSETGLASALGIGSDSNVSYSSKPEREGIDPESLDITDPQHPANQKGYKIWVGNKVIYNFNTGFNPGFFNDETGLYELTAPYQLKLHRSGNGAFLSVYTRSGDAAQSLPSEELLWALKDQISSR